MEKALISGQCVIHAVYVCYECVLQWRIIRSGCQSPTRP